MASRITIILTDEEGNGLPDQSVYLRVGPTFGTNTYEMNDIPGKSGSYQTSDTIATGKYKLWVNGSEDKSFGGEDGREITMQDDLILKVTDESGTYWECRGLEFRSAGVTTEANSLIRRSEADDRYLQLSGDTMSGTLAMGTNPITGVLADADPTSVLPRGDIEDALQDVRDDMTALIDDKASLSDANVFSGTQKFGNVVDFIPYCPTTDSDPTTSNSLTRKSWVLSQIAAITVTPFQNSPNKVRLIPGGTTETAKVYTTYALAQNYARLYPASNDHRIQIDIEGAGSGGTTIAVTNGAISGNSAFNSYVSLKGANQNINLVVDDDAFSVTAGSVILTDLKISRDDDGDGTPSFANFKFVNCYFDFDTASLNFNGCEFINCTIKNTGTVSFTSCKGGPVLTTGTLPSTIQGWGGISIADL